MKKKVLILFLLLSSIVFSQEKFSKEFRILSDNDLYTSLVNDRYYSNGLFLSFKYLSNSTSEKLHKKILEWEIGQEMYTPFTAKIDNPALHDRPFAAYLFGSFSNHFIYKNQQNLKLTLQAGFIGKNAFGKEAQNFVHDLIGFYEPIGWEFQIKDAFAINLNVNYVKHLGMSDNKVIDFNLLANGRVGTVFTDASFGFLSRIGLSDLTNIANSIAFGTNINNSNTQFFREKEAFLYVKPLIHTVLYDATLQGSFLNTGSPITKDPKNIRFEIEFGLQFTANRFNFSYAINYQTNKTDNLRFNNGNRYGRISITYLIR